MKNKKIMLGFLFIGYIGFGQTNTTIDSLKLALTTIENNQKKVEVYYSLSKKWKTL